MNDRPARTPGPTSDALRLRPRTIRDVARLAGVSIGTASKALNASGRLSAETRAKVLGVAKAIDYRPNDLAQSLHRARSMTVGILSNDSFGRFSFPDRRGARAAPVRSRHRGLHVQRHRRSGARAAPHRSAARQARRRSRRHRAPRRPARARSSPRRAACRCLRLLAGSTTRTRFCLLPDDEGGREARGRAISPRSAAGASPISPAPSASRRCACARTAIARRSRTPGCRAPRRPMPGRWSEALGTRGGRRICSRGARAAPDALFCGNDQIARGAIDALREMGLAVPGDVAVVGFDNWDVMTEATRPPLTSVDMNLDALGREAGARAARDDGGPQICRRAAAAVLARRARIVRRRSIRTDQRGRS